MGGVVLCIMVGSNPSALLTGCGGFERGLVVFLVIHESLYKNEI
jgi:hypothetical protein